MLHVTEKTFCGYHSLQSVFLFLDSLYDEIIFYPEVEFNNNSANIPLVPKNTNLIHKSVEFLKKELGDVFIPHAEVNKNIPISAGLAGGSADLACFLNFVLDFLNFSFEEKLSFAKKIIFLGSDVPICFYNNITGKNILALNGTGNIEEITEPAFCLDNLFIVIVNNFNEVSTKKVFDSFEGNFLKKSDIKHIDINFIINSCNSLQNTAINICCEISFMLEEIKKTNPIVCRMSGSGSSCFAIYDDFQKTEFAARILSEKFKFVIKMPIYMKN